MGPMSRSFPLRVALAALSLSGVVLSFAQEHTEESFIPNFAVASAYYSWSADTDFSDAPGSLGMQEAGVGADLPLYLGDRVKVTAGFSYRWNELDFSGVPQPLASQTLNLHRLDLPVNVWADLNERWKLWLRFQPGWYSDFENVGSEDFTVMSLGVLSYQWTDWLKVAFGAFYSRETGEERILPALGFILEPDPHWYLALTFPRVEMTYAPTADWLLSARVVANGGSWNISNPAGTGPDVDLSYQAVRLGLGVDRRLVRNWWAYLEGGVQIAQEIEIQGGGYDFLSDLDSNAYLSTGVRLRF